MISIKQQNTFYLRRSRAGLGLLHDSLVIVVEAKVILEVSCCRGFPTFVTQMKERLGGGGIPIFMMYKNRNTLFFRNVRK